VNLLEQRDKATSKISVSEATTNFSSYYRAHKEELSCTALVLNHSTKFESLLPRSACRGMPADFGRSATPPQVGYARNRSPTAPALRSLSYSKCLCQGHVPSETHTGRSQDIYVNDNSSGSLLRNHTWFILTPFTIHYLRGNQTLEGL
jgi:hypothetical protein